MKTIRFSPATRTTRRITRTLIGAELIVGLRAVPCGILLIFEKLGMPRNALDHTPFENFWIPGLLLSLVVGGSLLAAAYVELTRRPHAPMFSGIAGGILLGWVVVESIMVRSGRVLQVAIFSSAILIIGLSWWQLRHTQPPQTDPIRQSSRVSA